jgi:hypothetical protein
VVGYRGESILDSRRSLVGVSGTSKTGGGKTGSHAERRAKGMSCKSLTGISGVFAGRPMVTAAGCRRRSRMGDGGGDESGDCDAELSGDSTCTAGANRTERQQNKLITTHTKDQPTGTSAAWLDELERTLLATTTCDWNGSWRCTTCAEEVRPCPPAAAMFASVSTRLGPASLRPRDLFGCGSSSTHMRQS